MNDYTCALHDILLENWDNLFLTMMRTTDDLLRKKIEQFLHHYYHSAHTESIRMAHDALLAYVYHAQNNQIIIV